MDIKYKANLRLPTDQYAYVEIQVEDTIEEIIQTYRDLVKAYQGHEGLVEAEWQKVLDEYLWGKSEAMDSEEYANMNLEQQNVIQTIKKSRNRKNYKLNKK